VVDVGRVLMSELCTVQGCKAW